MQTWRNLSSAVAMILVCSAICPAEAREGRCQVDGIIVDQEGKPVPGARILLEHESTGQRVELKSAATGRWSARNIAEGEWKISFSRRGYVDLSLSRTVYPAHKRNKVQTQMLKTPFAADLIGAETNWDFPSRTAPVAPTPNLQAASDLRKIVESLESMLAEDPEALDLHTRLGDAYLQLGDTEQALKAYTFVHEKDPTSAAALSNLAEVHLKRKDVDKALECLDKLLVLSPNHANANYNMAEILLSADEPEEAIQHYEAAIVGRPGWAAPYLKIGYAAMTLGRSMQARSAFQKYLALEPDGPEASFVRDTLQLLQ